MQIIPILSQSQPQIFRLYSWTIGSQNLWDKYESSQTAGEFYSDQFLKLSF